MTPRSGQTESIKLPPLLRVQIHPARQQPVVAYSFGLPIVATDVGSFREEIVEGSTGFLCKPGDPAELAKAIERYFASDLYKNLEVRRLELKDYADANHSWHAVAELTGDAYAKMLGRNQ